MTTSVNNSEKRSRLRDRNVAMIAKVKPDTQKRILPGEHSVPWRANKCEGGETNQTKGA